LLNPYPRRSGGVWTIEGGEIRSDELNRQHLRRRAPEFDHGGDFAIIPPRLGNPAAGGYRCWSSDRLLCAASREA
jgi:hypothetical protein